MNTFTAGLRVAAALLAFVTPWAQAQSTDFPNKPIRVVVPFPGSVSRS